MLKIFLSETSKQLDSKKFNVSINKLNNDDQFQIDNHTTLKNIKTITTSAKVKLKISDITAGLKLKTCCPVSDLDLRLVTNTQ